MATHDFDIIGAGSPIVDLLVQVEEEHIGSIAGEKGGMELVDSDTIDMLVRQCGTEFTQAPGGAAANTISAASRLGLKTTFIGMVGSDDTGSMYLDSFTKIGCDTSRFIRHARVKTACCLSMITPDSERTMRTHLGAAAELKPDNIRAEDFAGCKYLYVEGYLLFNRDLITTIIAKAREAGCKVAMDFGSFEMIHAAKDFLPQMLKDSIDVILANEEEAEAFTGQKSAEEAARILGDLCEVAVVKRGRKGSIIRGGDITCTVDPISPDRVVDSTGAGDMCAAGIMYGIVKELPLSVCGELGSIMGGNAVRYIGSIPPEEEWPHIRKAIEKTISQGVYHD